MAKFLTSTGLNTEIENLIDNAEESIVIISPYIKLHDRLIKVFQTKRGNPKVKITIVFGKNEENLIKSMKAEDLDFFKTFPNIEIRYEKNLHAKYYSNEITAILTSMNLHNYSQNNNIEAGILFNTTTLSELSNLLQETVDGQADQYFKRVIHQSDLLFKSEPEYERTTILSSKKLKSVKIITDKLSDFFKSHISKIKINTDPYGFCIRTGNKIPFDPKHPFSIAAYKIWSKSKDETQPEKYCHFSGEESNGNNSYEKPILSRNWSKAKSLGLVK
ncbi:MAG: phospholipase D family protein [Ferruginibacter sp.]